MTRPGFLLMRMQALLLGFLAACCTAWTAERFVLDPLCLPGPSRNPPLAPGNPAPSTKAMSEWLQRFYESVPQSGMMFMNGRLADLMARDLAATTNGMKRLNLMFALGLQQTQAGRPDLALNTYQDLEDWAGRIGFRFDAKTRRDLRLRKVIAFMRLGEQENCLLNRNGDACVFPLRPRAYHQLPRGSRGAVALLNEHLQ